MERGRQIWDIIQAQSFVDAMDVPNEGNRKIEDKVKTVTCALEGWWYNFLK